MSGLRCWPGCLAIVIEGLPENVGRVVECVRYVPPGGDAPEILPGLRTSCGGWTLHAAPPLTGIMPDGSARLFSVGFMADRDLRPITPPPGADTAPTSEPVQEAA